MGVFSRSQHLHKLGLGEEFPTGSDDTGQGLELRQADGSAQRKDDRSLSSSVMEGARREGLALELAGGFSSSATGGNGGTDDLKLSSASESTGFSVHQLDVGFEADHGESRMAESSVPSDAPLPLSSPSEQDEDQWQRFKSDFAASLEGSHAQLQEESHSHPTSPVVESLRQQLLIDAIAAMHSIATEKDGTHASTTPSLHDSDIGTAVAGAQPVGQSRAHLDSSPASDRLSLHTPAGLQSGHTPLSPASGLLSVNTLETIPELELEQLLESVESKATEAPVGVSRTLCRGPPPIPGFAWEVGVASEGSDDLMQQLEQLSEERWKAGPEGRRDTPTTAGRCDGGLGMRQWSGSR